MRSTRPTAGAVRSRIRSRPSGTSVGPTARPAGCSPCRQEARAVLAGALAKLHRESHAIYKPDEIARSNATRIYRSKNPAANYAAGDRVIYPTRQEHRDAILKTGELPPVK